MLDIEKQFGVNLKKYRKAKKLSQEELAEMLNIARNTLSKLERGKSFVSAAMLSKICEALKAEAYELFLFDNYKAEDFVYYKKLLDNLKSNKIKRNPMHIKLLYELTEEFLNTK